MERGHRRKLSVVRLVQGLGDGVLPTALEAVALAIHLQDREVMGETVEHRSNVALRAEDFRPLVEGEIGGNQDGDALVAPAEDLEEQFRPRWGTWGRSLEICPGSPCWVERFGQQSRREQNHEPQ